jgi:hypothetical protein
MLYINLVTLCLIAASSNTDKNYINLLKFRWKHHTYYGPVHLAYNPSYLACFFSRNSIFLSQKISQQCFSAGL